MNKIITVFLLLFSVSATAKLTDSEMKRLNHETLCDELPQNSETSKIPLIDSYLRTVKLAEHYPDRFAPSYSEDQINLAHSRLKAANEYLTSQMRSNFDLMQQQLCRLKDDVDKMGLFKDRQMAPGPIGNNPICQYPKAMEPPVAILTEEQVAEKEKAIEAEKAINVSLLGSNNVFKQYYERYISFRNCQSSLVYKYPDILQPTPPPSMTVQFDHDETGGYYKFNLKSNNPEEDLSPKTACSGYNGEYRLSPKYACVMMRASMWNGETGFFRPPGDELFTQKVSAFQKGLGSALQSLQDAANKIGSALPVMDAVPAIN